MLRAVILAGIVTLALPVSAQSLALEPLLDALVEASESRFSSIQAERRDISGSHTYATSLRWDASECEIARTPGWPVEVICGDTTMLPDGVGWQTFYSDLKGRLFAWATPAWSTSEETQAYWGADGRLARLFNDNLGLEIIVSVSPRGDHHAEVLLSVTIES